MYRNKVLIIGLIGLVIVMIGILFLQQWKISSSSVPRSADYLTQAQSLKDQNQKIQSYLQGIGLAYNELGILFHNNKDFANAANAFQAAFVAFNQEDTILRDSLSKTYVALGNVRKNSNTFLEAACAYKRALEYSTQDQQLDVEKRLNAVVDSLSEEQKAQFQTMTTAQALDACMEIAPLKLSATIPMQTKSAQPDSSPTLSAMLWIVLLLLMLIIIVIIMLRGRFHQEKSSSIGNRGVTIAQVEQIASQVFLNEWEQRKTQIVREIVVPISESFKQQLGQPKKISEIKFSEQSQSSPDFSTPENAPAIDVGQRQRQPGESVITVASQGILKSPFPRVRASAGETISQGRSLTPEEIVVWWREDGNNGYLACQKSLSEKWKGIEIVKISGDQDPDRWKLIAIRLSKAAPYYVIPRPITIYDAQIKSWFKSDPEFPGRSDSVLSLERPARTQNLKNAEEMGLVKVGKFTG